MIKTNDEILELVKSNFENVLAVFNKWNEATISYKSKNKNCTFDFRKIDNDNQYCAEYFKGHNCLAIGYNYKDGGECQMIVADEYDVSEKILNYIEKKLNIKRKKVERYEQLLLFEF